MKVSDAAKAMIKHHEGVRMRPYRCPALLWTVGVGHVIDPTHATVKFDERRNLPVPDGWDRSLTMGEVDDILAKDLARFERGVARYCPAAVNSQGQFNALVSFAFNVGLGNLQRSSIRMRYNRGDIEGAADAFLMWTKAAGRVLPGLVKRRQDERAMFLARLGSS
jgi:lysozyme